MIDKKLLAALALTFGFSLTARAAVRDITPVSVHYQSVVANDITGARSLRVVIRIKNVGPTVIRASHGGVLVAAVWNTSAALYGPVGGGYQLGAPIAPGRYGQFLFYAPIGSLKRCQKTKVMVDTTRSLQSGPVSIYYNDSIVLPSIDLDSPAVCPGGVFQP